ncbi:hypothetical protein P3T37_003827 [Kitasatospora sp. MAA4]|uniref:DUF4241 domain-containing protein n=1 Tax=Kitasatospora sp. MAA4 TaxID=3035093 RepID=UPI002474F699|nr:DUF4241 domain-containing protein [Kitasatospora sp. MAA4]MDH6134424.1 hypothetical protein [Kitasatospora sp. MAA4]
MHSEVLVEAVYGDGWDPSNRSTVRPIPREEAARRDAAGEPYAVVFTALGQELPMAVLHVAWSEQYLGFWRFDSSGRRVFEADLRRLEPGRLFLRHLAEWRYEQQDLPDRSDEALRWTVDLYPDGKNSRGLYPRGRLGGSTHTLVDLPRDLWWLPVPEFGRWEHLLAAGQLGLHGTVEIVEETANIAPQSTTGAAEPFGWRPPVPATAPWPDELFTPGFRFVHRHRSEPLTIEPVRTVIDISLPSGRLAVCDPSYLPDGQEGDPLVIEVPRVVYPVQETGASYEDEMFGDRFTARDTYAVRLLVSQKPTVSWTMAIPPGEDARLLRDGQCFGFGVDSATGCFVDPTARTELGRRYVRALTSGGGEDVHGTDDGYSKVTDDATGAELVTFMLGGDGVHPVWVGRDASGEVTAVVVANSFEVGYLEPLDE